MAWRPGKYPLFKN